MLLRFRPPAIQPVNAMDGSMPLSSSFTTYTRSSTVWVLSSMMMGMLCVSNGNLLRSTGPLRFAWMR